MDLVLALVCDEARVDSEGKLHVQGAFNDLYAPGFPAKQERMVLVLVLEWDRADHGRYQFVVDLVGPGGTPSLTLRGHSDVDARSGDRPPARTRLLMPLENVVFPEPGPYRFKIRMKGRELEGPAVHVVRSEPASETAAGVGREPLAPEGGSGGS